MRPAEFIESEHIIAEVKVSKELVGVVVVGKAIGATEAAGGSAIGDVLVDTHEYQVEDKGSKDGTERTALGKAFKLLEKGPKGVGSKEPASVGAIVK